MNTYKFFNLIVAFVFAFSLLGAPVQVSAQESAFPSVDIDVYNNSAYASNWPAGAEVTISFGIPADDIESNEIEWVYSETAIAPVWDGGGWCQFIFNIDPAEFRIAAGQAVRITDGTTTRQATFPDVQVTSEDPTANTISGTAPEGSTVNLWTMSSETGVVQRNAIANNNGVWFADFAHPGTGSDEQGTFDVIPGTGFFWVSQPISDFVGIKFMWDFGPYFHVFPEDGRIETYVWPFGANLILTIDDPATQENPDLTRTQENLAWQTNFDELGTILPDTTVSITDGLVTKTHTVTDLELTGANAEMDTVAGTAGSDGMVEVRVCGEKCWVSRHVSAEGADHSWLADFHEPGQGNDEQDVLDLGAGDDIDVWKADIDGDATTLQGRVPYPEPPQCQPGDTVAGTVFEHDGITPVPFAKIQIDDYNTGEVRYTTIADSSGTYGCSLPDGDYRILAWTDPYTHTQEYYNEATDVNATPLHISASTQLANINFTISPIPVIEHFTFNLQNLLLQDLAVRRAIALGTDRQRILKGAFLPNGIYGMVSNSIVPPEHWASAPASELDLYPFDPAGARAILESAGWTDRDSDGFRENANGDELEFTFKTRDTAVRMTSGEIFRENLAGIGIRINTEYLPDLQEITDQHNFDIAEFGWTSGWDNEPNLDLYFTDSPLNIGGYSNIAYDTAITNARTEVDDAGKLPHLIEAQNILTHDLPVLPLFTRYDVTPVTTSAGSNVTVSPESYLDVHFAEVTQEGLTTVLGTSLIPADLPPNFQLLGQVYDIGTSASFTNAQVCFAYDDSGLTPIQESSIRLFHLEQDAWVDVTDSGYPDTTANQVCGTVTDFSPFAIMYALNQPYTSFVVFGQEGVWLKENTDVLSGDVAANIASAGPYLADGSEVTIGQEVRFMDPVSRVMGDTVYLKQGSQVYDVYTNQLKGKGVLLGVSHTPLELPLVPQLPAVPSVNPGTQNFNLKKNGSLTLDAGSYGKLEGKNGATITFTGGVYHFTEWTLGDDVKIYFAAPTEIRIAGRLDIGTDAYIGPASGSTITAHDIFIYVLGVNGNNSNIGANPKAAKFGIRNLLLANVYAPNGTLWIRERSTATGAFFGRWVTIGENVTLTIDNGWE
jgi:hypothetical protein